MVQLHSVLQCAKIQNCTHTCGTHFGNTAGIPIPILNPRHELHDVDVLFWKDTNKWGFSCTIMAHSLSSNDCLLTGAKTKSPARFEFATLLPGLTFSTKCWPRSPAVIWLAHIVNIWNTHIAECNEEKGWSHTLKLMHTSTNNDDAIVLECLFSQSPRRHEHCTYSQGLLCLPKIFAKSETIDLLAGP